MKSFLWMVSLGSLLLMLLLALVFGWFAWQTRGATTSLDEERAIVDALSKGRCTEPDEVDRWLLQQSWFHDAAATRLAGIFGSSSFGLYNDDDLQPLETHAAFCISGREMRVRYYERQPVPISIGWGDPHGIEIKFGTRVVPGGSDRIAVRELTYEHMLLHFESDGRERRFYRRR